MNYIILDLEFNQDYSSLQDMNKDISRYAYEIIQIGAVKLDKNFTTIATFNRYIKPVIFNKINPFVTDLTGITTIQLQDENPFPEILKSFLEFIGEEDSILCIWGMSDIKILYRNAEYHQIDYKTLPNMYINLQPFASLHLGLPKNNPQRLQYVVEILGIPISYQFHNALNDAYYTAEIFKKIYNPSIPPNHYDPSYVAMKPRQKKRIVDYDRLIKQFEKIYGRIMTKEEQDIIVLAYKMGKTNQFVK